MLSSHLFFCLPLLLAPFTVPCKIVFAMPEDLEMWPYHLSYRFFTMVRRSSCTPIAFWSCDATFTKYLLNTFAISFSSEINRSFSCSPSRVSFASVLRDAPNSLKIFQILRGSSLPFSILVLYILFLADLIIEETLFLSKTSL